MSCRAAFLIAGPLLLGWAEPRDPRQDGVTLDELRTRIDTALAGELSAVEFETLSSAALGLAANAGSRSAFWNALGAVALLCGEGPRLETRALRAQALRLLAQRESDTLRWSALLGAGFLPPFARLPREDWASALAAYDKALDDCTEGTTSERVRAELMYAKAYARVYINRRWDWLTAAQRRDTLALLDALAQHFGTLPVPGTSQPLDETVERRARQHGYELSQLYFGAPAPATKGVDLDNVPLNLADYLGQVVVLDFWTSFCQPCLALVPAARDLLAQFAGEPVVYLGVCGDTDRLAGAATAQRMGMTWRNLWDGPRGTDGPASLAWNVPPLGWPSVFVIDANGRIRYKLRGKDDVEARLEGALQTLLAELVE